MRLSAAAVLTLFFAVAACSPSAETPPEAAPTAPADPIMLGGVDLNQPLRALGTEPFWGVAITPEALVYSGVDRPEQRASNPGPEVQGTTAVYTATLDQGSGSSSAERDSPSIMVVTIIATECSDGMSDRVYPLTARVELGEETLNGCAQSAAALDAEPRP